MRRVLDSGLLFAALLTLALTLVARCSVQAAYLRGYAAGRNSFIYAQPGADPLLTGMNEPIDAANSLTP